MQYVRIKETDHTRLLELAIKYDVNVRDLVDIAFEGLFDGADHGNMELLFNLDNQVGG